MKAKNQRLTLLILAKHDENYMPPELAGARHKTETLE